MSSLPCKRCGADCSQLEVEFRARRRVDRCGDGYGWEELVTLDAGVFCSVPCLWSYLEGSTVVSERRDPFYMPKPGAEGGAAVVNPLDGTGSATSAGAAAAEYARLQRGGK